jgi:hypothetical protein
MHVPHRPPRVEGRHQQRLVQGQVGAQRAEEGRLRQRGKRERAGHAGHPGLPGQVGRRMGCHPQARRRAERTPLDPQRGRPSRRKRGHPSPCGGPSRRGERHRGEQQDQAGQAGQAGEVHSPVVPVTLHPGDTGCNGQDEEGLPRQPFGGRSARPPTAGTSTPRSASWPIMARGRSPRRRACCGTCGSHLRETQETSPGGGTAPTIPPAARGATVTRPRSSRPNRT